MEKGFQARRNMMVGTEEVKSNSLKVWSPAEHGRAPLFPRAWVWCFPECFRGPQHIQP